MKIYNLILLNFCFLQLFPLLFGTDPGEGSGSKQKSSQGVSIIITKYKRNYIKHFNSFLITYVEKLVICSKLLETRRHVRN